MSEATTDSKHSFSSKMQLFCFLPAFEVDLFLKAETVQPLYIENRHNSQVFHVAARK